MKKIAKLAPAVAIILGSALSASSVAAQTCGNTYTVKSGDTLAQIASNVYGAANEFQILYSANAAEIGADPSLIFVGQKLNIPCIDGELEASTADAEVLRPIQTTETLPAPKQEQIRFVAGSNYAPFHDRTQEQGGMITEIANVAMANVPGTPDYKIDIISDWSAHLQPLISDHAYDFSLSWFRPNCDLIERLGEDSQFRCNNLAWSDPMYEQIFGYYTRASDPSVADYEALFGKKVCRPAGYAIFMLEEHFLTEPNVELIRANGPSECFELLNAGGVDVVAIAAGTADGIINDLDLGDDVQLNQGISQVVTFHAVISVSHPQKDDYLDALNAGLQEIKDTGEWFSIVRRHLTEFRSAQS